MSEETTPLLGTVRTKPRKNLGWRLLTYSGIGVFFLIVFNLLFLPRTSLRRDFWRLHGSRVSLDDIERTLFESIDSQSIRGWSKKYTSEKHLAGEAYDLVEWTRDQWQQYGLDTKIETYDIYMNYPVDNGLKLLNKDGSVKYKAILRENILDEDPTTGRKDSVPAFHGYSASGNVTGQLVYVNYGTKADYDLLVSKGIDFSGKIVIAKYGGLFRGLKVKFAQELGAAGVIIYSDPQDDLPFTERNGYAAYPDGPARNPSAIQRGSVQFLSYGPGDPTTPGYPSKGDVERVDPYYNIPKIPSLPLSYQDAIPFLQALNQQGLSSDELGDQWKGELDGVDYNVGPSELEVTLFNEQDYAIRPNYNVIGTIEGIIKDEVVIVGNHRDAWIVGGAADPNSGSAVLMEFAKALSELQKIGWKPLRTIMLASWDGEEYGLLGSTEWGEDYAKFIKKKVVSYLNLDSAVSGSRFSAHSSPVLQDLLNHITKRIPSPNGHGNLHEKWREQKGGARIATLGSGSDYTVFLDHLGIPSLDFGFGSDPAVGDAVYQYHSNYDSFYWMDTYGDPDWKHHRCAAQLIGLLSITLTEKPLLHFKLSEYSSILDGYLDKLESKFDKELSLYSRGSFKDLRESVKKFVDIAKDYDSYTADLEDQWTRDYAWYHSYSKFFLLIKMKIANEKLKVVEKLFLTDRGLDGRPWFKHSVFAPGRYTGYAGALLPGLTDALEDRRPEGTFKWIKIINGHVEAINHMLS